MARKRKLNVKFLILLVGIPSLLVLLVGAYGGYRWYKRGTPAQHAAMGKSLYEAGQYYDAGEKYKRAIQIGGPNAEYYTLLGDCYNHQVLADQENLRLAKACWDQALAIDPRYMPALKRLFELYQDDAELNRGSQTGAAQRWDAVSDTARKILAIDPTNREAQKQQYVAVIQKRVAGVEADQRRIDEAIEALLKMSKEKPFDADTVFFAAWGKIYAAQEAMRQNEKEAAKALLAEAPKLIEDALKEHPDDPVVHLRQVQMLRVRGQLEREPDQPFKYMDQVKEEAAKAAALIKPDQEQYVEIKSTYAWVLDQARDPAGAEKVYREILEKRPDEALTRIALAELLGRTPERRDEAMQLLNTATALDEKKFAGIRALAAKYKARMAMMAMAHLKLDGLAQAKDRKEFDQQLKEVEEIYAKVTAHPGVAESPGGLHLRGRIEMAKGQNVQAVQTLDRALKLVPAADRDERFKIMFLLARSYMTTQQTGEAKSLLTTIVSDFDSPAARITLAQLLLRENNFEEARKHLEEIQKVAPDLPLVTQLTMYTLDRDKDKEKLAALYDKLPAGTPEEMVSKAQMAAWLKRQDEAARLLETVHSKFPDDLAVTSILAGVYKEMGQKDKALALVKAALSKDPQNPRLQLLQSQFSGATAEQINEQTAQMIQGIKDPFLRELALFQHAAQQGQEDEALKHLQEAAKLKPDDDQVLRLQFQVALGQKDWTKASALVEKLAAKNLDQAGGLDYRVRLALAKGDTDQAADQALQLTQRLPEFAQSWTLLGKVKQLQGKLTEAVQHYNTAIQKQPQNLEALVGLIECTDALNRPDELKQYIEQGQRQFPADPAMRDLAVGYELKWGDPTKAIAPRQEVLDKAPDQIGNWVALGDVYLAAARAKGAEKSGHDYLQKAHDTYRQASAKWPDEPHLVEQLAMTAQMLGNVSEGEKAIQQLRARPAWQNKPEPTLMLASYCIRSGKPADGEKLLRDYLAGSPTAVPVQLRLSSVLAQQNKLDEALKVLQPNADDPAIRKQRIELQIGAGKLADAEKEIQTALAGNPNPSSVLLNRQAYLYLVTGRFPEAQAVLAKVLAKEPGNVEALLYRAQARVSLRRNLDEAIRDLQRVRDSMPDNMQPRMLLAEAYNVRGDDGAAIRELQAAIRQSPSEKQPRLRLYDFYRGTNPPSWPDAERLLADSRKQPQLTNDPDLLHAEATMWLERKEVSKAREAVIAALKAAPNSLNIFRTYCDVLLADRKPRDLLASTDSMVQSKQAPWWVYQYRGRAKKALDDKAGALEEFSAGIDLAGANKNDDAVAAIAQTIAQEIGVQQAMARVAQRAEAGQNRYRMLISYLLQNSNDFAGALGWLQKVMDDPKSTSDDIDAAERVAGTLYLRLDPPDPKKAVEIYRKLLERSPNDAAVLNNLACTMILPNSGFTPKDALEYSQRAYDMVEKRGITDPYIYDTQGYVLVLMGRVEEGISLLRAAIDRKPITEAYYHLGEAYLALPQPQGADAEDALKQATMLWEKDKSDGQPVDVTLKANIDKALDRSRQVPATRPGAPTTLPGNGEQT